MMEVEPKVEPGTGRSWAQNPVEPRNDIPNLHRLQRSVSSGHSEVLDCERGQRTNAWTHIEEVFLIGSILRRWLKRGSLSTSREKGKSEDDSWVHIKAFYDLSWKRHCEANPDVKLPTKRSANALARHFKVMKIRLNKQGVEEDFTRYYYEWEVKYNRDEGGLMYFLKQHEPKTKHLNDSLEGVGSREHRSYSNNLVSEYDRFDHTGVESTLKSNGQGRFKRQMRDKLPGSYYNTVSAYDAIHMASELRMKKESLARQDKTFSSPHSSLRSHEHSARSGGSDKKQQGNHGNVFELFGLSQPHHQPRNSDSGMVPHTTELNFQDHDGSNREKANNNQFHLEKFCTSPEFDPAFNGVDLMENDNQQFTNNNYYHTVAGADGIHMAEQLHHEQEVYHREMTHVNQHHHYHQSHHQHDHSFPEATAHDADSAQIEVEVKPKKGFMSSLKTHHMGGISGRISNIFKHKHHQ